MKRMISSGKGYAVLAFIPLSMLSIAACSTGVDSAPPPTHYVGAICTADDVDRFIGQPATSALGAEIQRKTGARTFRWLPEGTIVTMEYRDDRVNIDLDPANRIKRVRCG